MTKLATTLEVRAGAPLDAAAHRELTRRAVFECCKWTLAAGDRPALARFPLIISPATWSALATLAETLAQESDQAEQELLTRPELWARLGFSERTATWLRAARWSAAPRYTRFDFHPTADGLRITESNCDVAGGLLESSGLGALWASLLGRPPPDDPAGAFVEAFARRYGEGARVGLTHLESDTDDHQVARYLARRFKARGLVPMLHHPRRLRPGLAVATGSGTEKLDALYRFLPGDWLERDAPEDVGAELFASDKVTNPLSALLPQSKRFPLVWPALSSPLETWRRLLPEVRSPDEATGAPEEWVLKPALGNGGSHLALPGVTPAAHVAATWRAASKRPQHWVAQRRFDHQPMPTPDGPRFACLGVFVVDGRRAGAYARLNQTPVIDDTAQDAVVLQEAV
jgi:glutathionylspermidine synthase